MRQSDSYTDEHLPDALWIVNGALWQGVNKGTDGFEGFVRRDIQTGVVQQKFALHTEPSAVAIGFGSIWLSGLQGPDSIQPREDADRGGRRVMYRLVSLIPTPSADVANSLAMTPTRTPLRAKAPTYRRLMRSDR